MNGIIGLLKTPPKYRKLDYTKNKKVPKITRLLTMFEEQGIMAIIICKSDWSKAFNQFTIACELDMINARSAADIAFITSSSTSAWLLSPLECSPQKQNG